MQKVVRFDRFDVDLAAGQVHKRGVRVRLREKSFQVLASLLEQPGQVVTRDELRRRLWPDDVFVDFDNNLNTAVARLRQALGDSADQPRFIETLPKHGYRFLASVCGHTLPDRAPIAVARLVVLPFLNLSGDSAQEYFTDAVTDEVVAALASLAPAELAVIARTTSMHYKGTHKNIARIGRELGVDYVVEGGVRRNGTQILLNAQVIRCDDQMQVASWTHVADLDGLFEVEASLAHEIASRIGISSLADGVHRSPARSARVGGRPTENLEAYEEYIQGRYELLKLTPAGMAKARTHLEQAISKDPEFALAYDGLADLYWHLGYFGFTPPRDAFAAGILYALRALEIDNTLAETHALLGQFHKQLDFNWPEVDREMACALELNPSSPVVRVRHAAHALMPHGRLAEAVAEIERALVLDPLSTFTRNWLAVTLLLWRKFDRAIDEARHLLELDSTAYWAHVVIGGACREQHRFDEAVAAQRTATALSGNSPVMLGWLGLELGLTGHSEEARGLLARLEARAGSGYVPPTSFAWIHLGLGDLDRAFEWLDRAVDGRDQLMMPIKSYAFFDPIRSDARFAGLLRKMKLDS